MDGERLVEAVLWAANGKIVGRVRFQKIFYLLQQSGLEAPFRFSYHHYGPYSEELSEALARCRDLDRTVSEKEFPTEGGFYSVYELTEKANPCAPGLIPKAEPIAEMKKESSQVIELAATIRWLRRKERVEDWQRELRIRKGSKATDENVTRAERLLRKLGLV